MPQNIALMDLPGDGVSQEQELHGLIGPDVRDGNTQHDGNHGRHQRSTPLGVPLTGNRLFTTGWILGLGIPKAIYSNRGQSLVSPTTDWVAGIIFALLSFWLAVIETTRPELCPRFFEIDLAPFILGFIKVLFRNDVFLWLTSILPLLWAVDQKRQVAEYAASSELAQSNKDGSIEFMLGVSMAIFLFYLHALRVVLLWPRGFDGNVFVAFTIFVLMMLAYLLFLCFKNLRTNSQDRDSIAYFMNSLTICLHLRMLHWATPPTPRYLRAVECTEGSHFERNFFHYYEAIWGLICIVLEAIVTSWRGFEFPQILYSSVFLCFSLIRIWKGFSAVNFPSSVTSPWKVAYGGVRRAGRKAKAYVLGIYHRLWASERLHRF